MTPIVSLNCNRLTLGDAMLFRLDFYSVGIPVVRAVDFRLPKPKAIHQSFEGSVIAIPAFPINELP